MKKAKKAKRRNLAVKWVQGRDFNVEFRPVEDVYTTSANIIVLAFANTDTAFMQPPPPMAA